MAIVVECCWTFFFGLMRYFWMNLRLDDSVLNEVYGQSDLNFTNLKEFKFHLEKAERKFLRLC